MQETLQGTRWETGGYLEILSAERTAKVRAEPFEADREIGVGVFFGDDEDE